MKKVIIVLSIMLSLTYWSSAQNGLSFDGDNDLVQTNYPGVLGSEGRTFEAWVFVDSSVPASSKAILDYGLNIAGSRNTFLVTGGNGLSYISGGTNANIGTGANTVPVDEWVHVAFVLKDGIGFLYINGTEMGTGSLSTVNTPASNENVKIGQRVLGGQIPFNGSLDEIRIWNISRGIDEILANMNSEICTQHPNLQLYLRFNEGIAGDTNTGITAAADLSGNNYNGDLIDFDLTGTTSNWVDGSGISNGNSSSFSEQSACDAFTWDANSMLYTTSGIYTEVLFGANAEGCDSTATIDLTINTVNDSVTQDGTLLTANGMGATYQWVECPDMVPIIGATSQSYTAIANGDYAVIVTDSICSGTSDCFTVSTVGTIENEFGNDLLLFPNPTNGKFSIDMGEIYSTTTITVTDVTGKQIISNTYNNSQWLSLNLEEPSGVYLLIIETENKRAVIRLVKK